MSAGALKALSEAHKTILVAVFIVCRKRTQYQLVNYLRIPSLRRMSFEYVLAVIL